MQTLKTNDFICDDISNEQIAQRYMDLFSAFKNKKPEKQIEAAIYKIVGGKDKFNEISKEIEKQIKEIIKYHPNIKQKNTAK